MSVYSKEIPKYLDSALESVFNQSKKANEVVLVEDGKLPPELKRVIEKYQNRYSELKVVALPENMGLGKALAIGMKECNYEYVLRMDSDDICTNNRFEMQVVYLERNSEIDVLGGNISEFIEDVNEPHSYRNLPKQHKDILTFAKKRNPMNHMTVMFKKSAIEKVGGYQPFIGFEDYYLWVRLLNSGAKFHNLQEILVNVRVGNDMIGRRVGWRYIKTEISLFTNFYKQDFINTMELIEILPQRILIRLLPKQFLQKVYNNYLRA